MLTCNAARHRCYTAQNLLRRVTFRTFREYARTSAAAAQRSLVEMLPPWTMGHGRLSVGASFRARLVVFPAFGSVQRRSREEYPPTTPCICDTLNEHRLTGGERHGLGLNP